MTSLAILATINLVVFMIFDYDKWYYVGLLKVAYWDRPVLFGNTWQLCLLPLPWAALRHCEPTATNSRANHRSLVDRRDRYTDFLFSEAGKLFVVPSYKEV